MLAAKGCNQKVRNEQSFTESGCRPKAMKCAEFRLDILLQNGQGKVVPAHVYDKD
jgi:hypothetical protein